MDIDTLWMLIGASADEEYYFTEFPNLGWIYHNTTLTFEEAFTLYMTLDLGSWSILEVPLRGDGEVGDYFWRVDDTANLGSYYFKSRPTTEDIMTLTGMNAFDASYMVRFGGYANWVMAEIDFEDCRMP